MHAAIRDRQARFAPLAARRKKALPIAEASAGLVARALRVAPEDLVFVKGLVEASDGLASLFAERGGELILACPPDRARDLDDFLDDLRRELGARIERIG